MARLKDKKAEARRMNRARKSTNKGKRLPSTIAQHSAKCSVCQSAFVDDINVMLLRGKAYTTIARTFPDITPDSVRRHDIALGLKILRVEQCEKLWTDTVRGGWPKTKKATLDQALRASEFIARKAGAFPKSDLNIHQETNVAVGNFRELVNKYREARGLKPRSLERS